MIENTIREKLPEDFQTQRIFYDHGMIDMVVPRKDLKARLATVLDYLGAARAA